MTESAPRAGPRRFLAGGVGLLVLTYLGFVSLGLPDASYGVAWPSLRDSFMLREGAFGLGLAAVGIGFLCSSLSAGSLLRRFGVGRLLGGSTLVAGLGLAGFAFAPSWPERLCGRALLCSADELAARRLRARRRARAAGDDGGGRGRPMASRLRRAFCNDDRAVGSVHRDSAAVVGGRRRFGRA
jgi:MFS family permease